ncbi:MAG TPA: CYTH domain-containing protein [Candidatus Enteromonas pullicola]|uniref:CYTH domain-containing protein n=1 Tax=Candidatus Alloenteromonas pullicola TaxID=2840784 RepID=A0A9D1S342_9FIRM|nr:CYTH domain-containing protein [Candidatus Enteromonas pullicola]
MSNAIEIEAKALVSQDDYRKLAKLFPDSPRYTQTNHYIDSDKRILFKEGIALRIREKNDQYELTLKTPLSQGLLEKNCVITKQQFDDFKENGIFPKGDTSRFLTMLDIDIATLKILTSLTTDRIDVEYKGGLLSIDRNCYSGKTDYEVEFEYNNLGGAKKVLSDLFEENGIAYTFTKASKTRRAMEALEAK